MANSPALERIVAALSVARPPAAPVTVEKMRADMEAMQAGLTVPDDVSTEPADANGVPVEWIRSPGTNGERAILYLHGGGYVMGSINTHRYLMQGIGRAAGATVLAVDYRLAPEHPFPAAVDDSMSAWNWLQDQGFEASRAIVGGDSAGGGLTLATLLRLRDESANLPAAAVCLSPWTDLASAVDSTETKNNDPLVTSDGLRGMSRAYIGEASAKNPLISPILADLTGLAGLPPLLIQVGTAEHLRDDSTVFAVRAEAAGVDVTLEEWEDMIHVFQAFPTLAESDQAIAKIGQFARHHTGG